MRIALMVLAGFVALTAVGGGAAMAAGVDRRVDLGWLEGTPFSSFRLPGVLLAIIVGGSSFVAAVTLAAELEPAALLAVVAGVILAGWIVVEALVLNQPKAPTVAEVIYFSIGVAMIGLGLAS